MKKYVKNFLAGLLILACVFSSVHVYAAENISVSVTNKPKVDIMLSSRETDLDLTNFETDVEDKLKSLGIDTSEINFISVDRAAVSTNGQDASTIFNSWGRIGGSPGQWKLTTDSGISVIYNPENTSYITGFYSAESYRYKDMTIEFDMKTTDTDDDWVGVLLRFNLTEDNADSRYKKATTYMYLEDMNQTNAQSHRGLFKITNNILWDVSTATQLKAVSKGWTAKKTWTHYKFVVENNNIKFYRNNALVMDYTDPNPIKTGSFGLVNWSQPAMFRNYSASFTVYKEYKEVLREPKWRDNSHHIVVNVDDEIDETLTGSDSIGEILSRTMADNIHFIQWGTDVNKESTTDFISRNDNHGMFTYNSDYENAVAETAEYIKNLITQDEDLQYVIVGQPTNINVTPASLKTGVISEDYPDGRWFLHHDYEYFANNNGLSTQTEFYSPDLVLSFDKPGKYEIKFDDQLVKEIYAHRAPDAGFDVKIKNGEVILTSSSYDLDIETDIGLGKGIASEKWFYKEVDSEGWTEGKLKDFDITKTYMLKHEVVDFQGASSFAIKYIGDGKPVADFKIEKKELTKYEPLAIIDASYDPVGYDLTEYTWTLKKEGLLVGTYTTPVFNFNTSSLGEGNYTYSLVVKNSAGVVSESFTDWFTIIPDVTNPNILIKPESCDWKNSQDIELLFSDSESGLNGWQYVFTNSNVVPTSGYSSLDSSLSGMLTIDKDGVNYLHVKASDKAGNIETKTAGPYKIDNVIPVINSVMKEHIFDNNTVKLTMSASDSLSGLVNTDGSFGIATSNNPEEASWYDSKIITVSQNGIYYLFARDYVGNISEPYVIEVDEITTKVKVTVTWSDNSNKHFTRPNGIKINLLQNGDEFDTYVMSGTGNTWTYIFDELQAKDDNGNDYEYTVTYDYVESEKYPSDNYNVTGTYGVSNDIKISVVYNITADLKNINTPPVLPEPPEIDDDIISPYGPDIDTEEIGYTIKGSINWNDNSDKLGYRPKKILLTVLKDGEVFTQTTLHISGEDVDEYKFTNLPKYNDDLEVFQYSIIESFTSWYSIDEQIINAYEIDNDTKNAQYENGNMFSIVDFTNTFVVKNTEIPVVPGASEHAVNIFLTHNQPDEIMINMKMFETFYDNDSNETYSNNYNGIDYNIPIDIFGAMITKMPAGKYEISSKDTRYVISNISASEDNNVKVEGNILYISKTKEDVAATIKLNFTKKEFTGYEFLNRMNNFFGINGKENVLSLINILDNIASDFTVFNISEIVEPSEELEIQEELEASEEITDNSSATDNSEITGENSENEEDLMELEDENVLNENNEIDVKEINEANELKNMDKEVNSDIKEDNLVIIINQAD